MLSRIKILGAPDESFIREPMPLDQSLAWVSPDQHLVNPGVEIFLAQSAYLRLVEHTASDLENEVGGLLIGAGRVDPATDRPYILIEDILPALHTESGQTFVTFTQDTLVKLHGELENRFPGQRIVGWYHTHPGLGVFLSSYDRWLHEHFFNDPRQVALVIDPCQDAGGFFCWQVHGQLDPSHPTGFFEWRKEQPGSVVTWHNLKPLSDELPGEPDAGRANGLDPEEATW